MTKENIKMDFHHIPVLLKETIEYLKPVYGGIYVDGTLGGGGHSLEILKRIGPEGKLIGIDRDPTAIKTTSEKLKDFKDVFIPVHGNNADVIDLLDEMNIDHIDGMIMDLGVSSHQFDETDRGFTYREDVRLDMRMDTSQDFSAYDLVNSYSVEDLSRIFWTYGEERWAKRIAEFVVKNRPVETTGQLVEIIKAAVPASARQGGPHPARRVFQAIRIEVNNELGSLEKAIENAIRLLKPNGRLCIISFHSLEDRIVKQSFKRESNPCTCPKDLPVCICGKRPQIKILTRRPVIPSPEEIEVNPRSRSAKLRACKKL